MTNAPTSCHPRINGITDDFTFPIPLFFSSPYTCTEHSCFKLWIFTPQFTSCQHVPILNLSWKNTGHILKRFPRLSRLFHHCPQMNGTDVLLQLLRTTYPHIIHCQMDTERNILTLLHQRVSIFLPNFPDDTLFQLVVHHLLRSENHTLSHISFHNIVPSSHNLYYAH